MGKSKKVSKKKNLEREGSDNSVTRMMEDNKEALLPAEGIMDMVISVLTIDYD
jgi:hypothetical protein